MTFDYVWKLVLSFVYWFNQYSLRAFEFELYEGRNHIFHLFPQASKPTYKGIQVFVKNKK